MQEASYQKRDKLEIIAATLYVAIEPTIKNHIRNLAYLNPKKITQDLNNLIELNLLQQTPSKHYTSNNYVFETTDKGLEFLETFENYKGSDSINEIIKYKQKLIKMLNIVIYN